MPKLLERLFMFLVTMTLVFYALSAATHWARAAFEGAGNVAAPHAPRLIETFVATCFGVGAVVRLFRWLQDRRRAQAPRRGERAHRTRTAVRRPTDEPRGGRHPGGIARDDDPALTFGEEGGA